MKLNGVRVHVSTVLDVDIVGLDLSEVIGGMVEPLFNLLLSWLSLNFILYQVADGMRALLQVCQFWLGEWANFLLF